MSLYQLNDDVRAEVLRQLDDDGYTLVGVNEFEFEYFPEDDGFGSIFPATKPVGMEGYASARGAGLTYSSLLQGSESGAYKLTQEIPLSGKGYVKGRVVLMQREEENQRFTKKALILRIDEFEAA